MDYLAKNEKIIFIGQAVEYAGTAMTNTLADVSEEKKMEMPSNYSVMLIMALIPPIWFFVMDRKLEQIKSR